MNRIFRDSMISRRQFLRIIAFSGAAAASLRMGLEDNQKGHLIFETRLIMGTVLNLSLVTSDRDQASVAVQTCMDRMQELEDLLSRFKPESQVSRLNREGHLEQADPVFLELVHQSELFSRLTNGAFDITIKPLVDLYKENQDMGLGLPLNVQIEDMRGLVDFQNIRVEGSSIRFEKEGMGITLDGMAKGYIVDAGVAVLNELGFDHVLVEAGGDLLAAGEKGDLDPWRVGIQSPRKTVREIIAKFDVRNQAVATSGDYMQSFSKDLLHHHILDPRTGVSSPYLASSSVIAASGMAADVEAYLVTKELQILRTSGFTVMTRPI